MITHHPNEATLASYAAGTLSAGMAIVVATHLTFCPSCLAIAVLAESVGGALLDELPPVSMAPGSLDRVLARTEMPAPRPSPLPVREPGLPPPLNRCTFGAWRHLTFGMRVRPLMTADRCWAGLVEGAAGRTLPAHAHKGAEFTCVLSGAFSDQIGHYGPGDLVEVDAGIEHQPVTDSTGPCLCIIATEGIRLHGALGLAQRVLGW